MFKEILCAAVLAVGAQAEDRGVDLEKTGVDIPRLVLEARSAQAPDVAGVGLQTADEDSFDRRIVVFKPGTDSAYRMKSVQDLGGTPTNDLRIIDAVAVAVPKARASAFDSKLKQNPDILRVEEDFVRNWLNGDEEKGQNTPWGIDRVGAKKAWSVTRGAGVKVAVVDTGIESGHPDLKVKGGTNCIDHNASFLDDHGHGTHVAGTIAAQDNSEGVVGIAPDVELYGVKVLNSQGSATEASIIEGIQWTAENRMDVANFSLGGPYPLESLHEAVKKAVGAGVAVVVAAGNSGGAVAYPAAYPESIAIAASDSSDKTASFSSRGPEVDFIAPGVDIESTFKGGGYKKASGTSMACPHVAALAALAIASRGVHGSDAVRAALQASSKKLPDLPAEQQGAGMIDAGMLTARQLSSR